MSKKRFRVVLSALAIAGGFWALPTAGHAAPAGPYAAACTAGDPAMLVHITGFKARTGIIRVQSYGGDPDRYFDKGSYLKRVEVRVPAQGPLDVCLPVPGPGRYAVSVRHDLNGSGKTDMHDGGGMSGNPSVSVLDLILKRKPSPDAVAIQVGRGVKMVPIVLDYVQGGSFRPVA